MTIRLLMVAVFLCAPMMAQRRVSPRNTYERVICVVPLVGAGTPDDPRRPVHAPLAALPGTLPSRNGIIAFTYQPSDDGTLALVEFVAVDRAAFADLLADTNPQIKVFIKGKDKREDIEAEFKKHKKDFNIDQFGVMMP